jgi:hypothetical protein
MSIARTLSLSILLCVLIAAPVVSAQEEEPQTPVEETEPELPATAPAPVVIEPPPPAKSEPPDEKAHKGKLQLTGRVFVRETFADDGAGNWGAQTSIASARLGARYHWKSLRARIDVELRTSAKLRSAYVDLTPTVDLTVRGGLFKIPLSPLELTSSWVLPVADRGLISTILKDRLQVAGRRVGATVAWTPGASAGKGDSDALQFRARAGYFQGLDDLGNLLDATAANGFGKLGAVRFELGPVGASGEIRQGRPDLLGPIRTAWAASVDATLAFEGLRLWLEATLGSSWLVAEPTREHALFVEARGVAAWRFGGAKSGAVYVEPYLMGGLVDPDREIADDLVFETAGGINLGMWKRWRFQVELEVWRLGQNVPFGFMVAGAVPVDRTAVVVQLGAAF